LKGLARYSPLTLFYFSDISVFARNGSKSGCLNGSLIGNLFDSIIQALDFRLRVMGRVRPTGATK